MTIPDDIEKKAETLVDEWSNGPHGFLDLQEAIARAILAERERCAAMANEQIFDEHALAQAAEFGRGCHQAATEIHRAIVEPAA